MNWNIRETARALCVSERELLRLARSGRIPALLVNEQYLFNAVELQQWGATHGVQLSPEALRPDGESEALISLAAAIGRGGVHYGVAGASPAEVFDAVARLGGIPAHVDRALLSEVLRAREALASTGLGRGIAVPHPRDPIVLHVGSPIILLCFLAEPVDFNAIDGEPVQILFTLLSPTTTLHLRTLSRLTHALRDEHLNQLLAERAPRDTLLARTRELDTLMDRSAENSGAR